MITLIMKKSLATKTSFKNIFDEFHTGNLTITFFKLMLHLLSLLMCPTSCLYRGFK